MSIALSAQPIALLAGAVAAGVASGMMWVFSLGTLQGLLLLLQADAIRAMQAINIAVINPLFLTLFIGTGPFLALLAVLNRFAGPPSGALLAAALVYNLGVVGVTVLGNVPLNDALAAVDPSTASPGTWAAYVRPWLRYNTARALAGTVASGLLIVGAVTG